MARSWKVSCATLSKAIRDPLENIKQERKEDEKQDSERRKVVKKGKGRKKSIRK